MRQKQHTIMRTLIAIILFIFFSGGISSLAQDFVKSIDKDDNLDVVFSNSPKELKAKVEYKLWITHKTISEKDLMVMVTQGKIIKKKVAETERPYYDLTPYKPGELKLKIYRRDLEKTERIGELILIIK